MFGEILFNFYTFFYILKPLPVKKKRNKIPEPIKLTFKMNII